MLLLDSVTGNVVDIGWLPYPSPSGRLFFVGFADDSDWSPLMGASVWRLAEAGSVAERLRVVDDALVRFTSFAGWRTDRCVEFRGARTNEGERSFFLAERDGDWQLSEAAPPECAAPAG
jgi:hypothetical protein